MKKINLKHLIREIILNEESTEEYTNEIDCPPGTPRPDSYFNVVIRNTGLSKNDFELVSKLFGNWVWKLKPDQDLIDKFLKARPKFKQRLTSLYDAGKIRYASW